MKPNNPVLEDVLQQLVIEVIVPTAGTARVWCDRYPQYQGEISEFVSEWLIQEALGELPAKFDEALASSRAASHLTQALQEHAEMDFPGILLAAERIDLGAGALAVSLHANESFVELLDRRIISLESIPTAFLSGLANELRVSVRAIARWMAGGTRVSAYGVTTEEDESESKLFAQAWRECGLSEDSLRRWGTR